MYYILMEEAKTINNSQIEDILVFTLKTSFDELSQSNQDFSLKVEAELEKKYSFSKDLVSRINRTVFWEITAAKLVYNKDLAWYLDDKAKNPEIDLKGMAKDILEKYKEYLHSNFNLSGYNVSN